MKKSLTLSLVLVALVVCAGPGVAQQRDKQQSPPVGVEAVTVKSSKSNASERVAASPKLLKGTVTEVNNQGKTFTVAVVFSAANLSKLPTVGEIIDITYTQAPDGGPMEATTIRSSKSNASERVAASPKLLKGTVTEVNNQAKTITVAVVVSAANLSKLPTVGQVVEFTYTDPLDDGPVKASNLNLSKSNIN